MKNDRDLLVIRRDRAISEDNTTIARASSCRFESRYTTNYEGYDNM